MRGRHALAAAGIVVLLVTAGCMGILSGESTPTPTGEATPTATSTATATPTPTGTATPENGSAGGNESIYASPLHLGRFQNGHRSALDAAGNFTVETSRVVVVPLPNGSTARRVRNVTARVDLDSGRVFVRDDGSGGVRLSYRDAAGETFARVESGDSVTYPATGSARTAPEQYALAPLVGDGEFPPLTGAIANATLEYVTSETGQGRTLDVYAGEGTDVLRQSFFERLGVDPADASTVRVRLAVDRAGVLRSATVRLAVSRGGQTARVVYRVDYRRVGSTSVEPPLWLGTAKSRRSTDPPDRGDVVSATAVSEELGVAVTVEAPYRAGGIEPTLVRSQDRTVYGDAVNESRAGPVVDVELPNGTRRASITFRYDPASLPPGGEAELSVVVYDFETGRYRALDTTVTPATNRVTADVSDDGVYTVVHFPTYDRERGRVSERLLSRVLAP